jgi:hypothetical protein
VTGSTRDARPFLAHHLRRHADARGIPGGSDLHLLARWVENLAAGDPRMARIESTPALRYDDGSFDGGDRAEAMIDACTVGDDDAAREIWLGHFAEAVHAHWSGGAAAGNTATPSSG